MILKMSMSNILFMVIFRFCMEFYILHLIGKMSFLRASVIVDDVYF